MNNRGVSSLGLCHPKYPVGQLLQTFPADHMVFRWLDHAFNPKNSKNAVLLLKQPKMKKVSVHIINGPGLNNRRVQPHEITYGYTNEKLVRELQSSSERFIKKFRARLVALRAIIDKKHPDYPIDLAISPWLERTPLANRKVMERLWSETIRIFPEAHMIDNPVQGNFIKTPNWRFLKEKHGANPGPGIDIYDLDGEDWEGVDMAAYGKRGVGAWACFIWGYKDNLIKTVKDAAGKTVPVFQPFEKRTNAPTQRELKEYRYWMDDSALTPVAPNPADTAGYVVQPVPDGSKTGFLWKLGEGKNHAVILLPKNMVTNRPDVIAINHNQKRIDTGEFRGFYHGDGRPIYHLSRHIVDYPKGCVVIAHMRCFPLQLPGLRID